MLWLRKEHELQRGNEMSQLQKLCLLRRIIEGNKQAVRHELGENKQNKQMEKEKGSRILFNYLKEY